MRLKLLTAIAVGAFTASAVSAVALTPEEIRDQMSSEGSGRPDDSTVEGGEFLTIPGETPVVMPGEAPVVELPEESVRGPLSPAGEAAQNPASNSN
jgi:hypothetical protein